jgi:hypothetical protein
MNDALKKGLEKADLDIEDLQVPTHPAPPSAPSPAGDRRADGTLGKRI